MEYKLGYRVVSGWGKIYSAFEPDGKTHTSLYQYWNEEKAEWENEVVKLEFPLNFVGYLKALKVGAIRTEIKTKEITKQKLPPLSEFIFATNLKNQN